MLRIDSVSLSFSGKSILSGCYLEAEKGQVTGLLGRNGSGKSSLLKIIFGSLQPDFMHLRIDDTIQGKAYRNRKVAYKPQDPFFPHFLKIETVLSQIKHDTGFESPLLDIFESKKKDKINSLSFGQAGILETLWVITRPADYILLDEPFSGIAPLQVEQLQKVIRHAAAKKSIILTDHLYRALLAVSDKILLLHNQATYKIENEDDLILHRYIPDTGKYSQD